jgi:hypothetical protein
MGISKIANTISYEYTKHVNLCLVKMCPVGLFVSVEMI